MVVLGLPKLSDFIVRLFYLRLDYLNALLICSITSSTVPAAPGTSNGSNKRKANIPSISFTLSLGAKYAPQ